MLELAPGYARDLANQIGFLSAFLGGFAATLFGVLLVSGKQSKAVGAAIVLAALSGIAFILAVIASTQVIAAAHAEAPANIAAKGFLGGRIIMSAGFILGIYALLASIGFAGWARSRATGIATGLLAGIGTIVVTLTFSVV